MCVIYIMGFRRMNKTRKQTKKTFGGAKTPKSKPKSKITSDEKTAKRKAAALKGLETRKRNKAAADELRKQETARKIEEKKIADEKIAKRKAESEELKKQEADRKMKENNIDDETMAKRKAAAAKGLETRKRNEAAEKLKKQETARKRKEKKIEDEKKAQKLKEEQEERERKIQLARDHSTGSYESEYQDPDLKFIPSLSNSYELDSNGIRKPRWPSEDV